MFEERETNRQQLPNSAPYIMERHPEWFSDEEKKVLALDKIRNRAAMKILLNNDREFQTAFAEKRDKYFVQQRLTNQDFSKLLDKQIGQEIAKNKNKLPPIKKFLAKIKETFAQIKVPDLIKKDIVLDLILPQLDQSIQDKIAGITSLIQSLETSLDSHFPKGTSAAQKKERLIQILNMLGSTITVTPEGLAQAIQIFNSKQTEDNGGRAEADIIVFRIKEIIAANMG